MAKEIKKNELHFVIFGISGSGKTLIGKMLAEELGIEFIEGDDYHPQANVNKMRSGHPLEDADRFPWLGVLEEKIAEKIKADESFVMSCSALKVAYRNALRKGGDIKFLFLDVREGIVAERLEHREGHFMPPKLLHSQVVTLERPKENEKDIIVIDASQAPLAVVNSILEKI